MKYKNTYLMLPVTANFSFGGKTLRGFANLGIYAGYWMTSCRSGHDFNSFSGDVIQISEKVPFYSGRDRRWDFGYTGGVGLEYHFAEHWVAQAEVLCYYSAVSPVYLSRVVRQVTGRTVVDYINQMLLMEASFLLRNSQLSITQIADRLHFADTPSFSKFFLRLKGQSPRAYREGFLV